MGISTITLVACVSNDATKASATPVPTATVSTPEPEPTAAAPAPTPTLALPPEPEPQTSNVTDAGARDSTPTAQTRTDAGPPPLQWTATYNRPKEPEWCRTGYAQCFVGTPKATAVTGLNEPYVPKDYPASKEVAGCASALDVKCECSPHTGCFEQKMCVAPLMAQVTREQRGKKPGACCFAPPQRCPHPGEGRPLRVEGGTPIVASSTERAGWLVDLDIAQRPVPHLAEHWRKRAAGEHASIASFARVALDLMALGAPADLIARTHRAALDEIEHARIAYSIASAYGESTVGPGPLAIPPGAPVTFAKLTRETFFDACVEETLGAIALREEARVSDPAIAKWIVRIATEEEAHAELAWATLAWSVREGGAEASHALREAIDIVEATPNERAMLHEVILPCARALLESLNECEPIKDSRFANPATL